MPSITVVAFLRLKGVVESITIYKCSRALLAQGLLAVVDLRTRVHATLAQLVERSFRKAEVQGSSP